MRKTSPSQQPHSGVADGGSLGLLEDESTHVGPRSRRF